MPPQITAALITAAAALIAKFAPERSSTNKRGFDIASAALTVIAIVLLLTFQPIRHAVTELLSDQDTSSTQDSIPSPAAAQQPTGTKECLVIYDLDDSPKRSAVDPKTTTCPFAEEVRRAYAASSHRGATVQLRNVYSSKTKHDYTISCTGTPLVTCTGGTNARVYLY